MKTLFDLVGERAILKRDGKEEVRGIIVPPYTEFIDCEGDITCTKNYYALVYDKVHNGCVFTNLNMEFILDGFKHPSGLLTLELEPLQVKLQREGAKPPIRTGGEKSCWYDIYVSSIEVGYIDQGRFISYADDYIVGSDRYNEHTTTTGSVKYDADDVLKVGFGFALNLPDGKEAHILPRSGTFKKYGLLLTNSQGIIDTQYRGDGDEWSSFWYATDTGSLAVGDRIAQFKIDKVQANYGIEVVDRLENANRGGFGSTGRN